MPRIYNTALEIINMAGSDKAFLHRELVHAGYECKNCGKLLACGAKCPKCNPTKVN